MTKQDYITAIKNGLTPTFGMRQVTDVQFGVAFVSGVLEVAFMDEALTDEDAWHLGKEIEGQLDKIYGDKWRLVVGDFGLIAYK